MAIHSYWHTSISSWRSQLTAVWNKVKRPIWITEWNNGANWTSHDFPDGTGYTEANAEKQKNDITNIVGVMEEADTHIERYFIYNWVQDARAMFLNGKLTKAGEWYVANPSKMALQTQYDHQWKLVTTAISYTQSTIDPTEYTFTWQDYNGETAKGYVFERKGSAGWEQVGDTVRTLNNDESIIVNGAVSIPNITVTDHISASTQYRYRVIGYEESTANSTNTVSIILDKEIPSPTVTATPLSSSWIKLEWPAVTGAGSYRIYRAMYPDSIYTLVKDLYTITSFDNNAGLKPNTIYWYRVHSLNNRGESVNNNPVRVITRKVGGADGDGGLMDIESVTGDNEEPVAVEYYNLQGVRVGTWFTRVKQPGVYIVKEIYPSGEVRMKKVVRN